MVKIHSQHVLKVVLSAAIAFTQAPAANAKTQGLPVGTAIPVTFSRTISAKTSKTGEKIAVKTIQVVFNGPAETIPKGSLIVGTVEQASYTGKADPSSLEIKFSQIDSKHEKVPGCFSVRAMADLNHTYHAKLPVTSMDTEPSLGITLVGGDHIQLGGKHVYAQDGDYVGISNNLGVFSRLEPADAHDGSTPIACNSIPTLQSVAVFSSRACGLYGFSGAQLTQAGGSGTNGVIELQSEHGLAEIHSGSTALLQSIPCDSQ